LDNEEISVIIGEIAERIGNYKMRVIMKFEIDILARGNVKTLNLIYLLILTIRYYYKILIILIIS